MQLFMIASLRRPQPENLLGEGVRIQFPILVVSEPPPDRRIAFQYTLRLFPGTLGYQGDDLFLDTLPAAAG